MTTQTLQPATHISTRTLAMAGGGALLAVAAGFGVYALVEEAPPTTSETTTSFIPGTSGDLYDGTNREARALMHRR